MKTTLELFCAFVLVILHMLDTENILEKVKFQSVHENTCNAMVYEMPIMYNIDAVCLHSCYHIVIPPIRTVLPCMPGAGIIPDYRNYWFVSNNIL